MTSQPARLSSAASVLYPQVLALLCSPPNVPAFTSKTYGEDAMSFRELEGWRYGTLASRVQARPSPHLTRSELMLLMDWKLAKGKFRPSLPKLIASNEDEAVREVTARAFVAFAAACGRLEASPHDRTVTQWTFSAEAYVEALKQPLTVLCELRGVGPATATLILSLAARYAPPFFLDEMYAYFVSENKLKYTLGEYWELVQAAFTSLVELSLIEVEKGVWALEVVRTKRVKGKLPAVLSLLEATPHQETENAPQDRTKRTTADEGPFPKRRRGRGLPGV